MPFRYHIRPPLSIFNYLCLTPILTLPQSGEVDLQKAGHSVIMIKAQSISVRNGDQKEIEKHFDHGEVVEKSFGNKTVVDPTEGALDLSNSVGEKEFFDCHGPHLLASMIPFSFGQGFFPNEFCISRQDKFEKRKVISRG